LRMNNPPGPRGREVLGFVKNPLLFLAETAQRFGPLSYFRILGQRIYLVDDPELIQEILVTRQHEFNRDNGATLLRELIGDGLLTRDEPAHKERRRNLQPAFHRARVAGYGEMMVRESIRTAEGWLRGERIDAGAEMKRLTLAIVGASLFGADFRAGADRIAEVLDGVIAKSRWIAPFLFLLEPAIVAYRQRFPEGPSLFYRRERAELEQILKPVIEARRGGQSEDILSMLLEEMTDRDAANETVTMVLAGHETTATALTWAWHLIAKHPHVEGRMHAEIDEVLEGQDAEFEDLPRLSYIGAVFNEAMRLYPPAPAFGRRPKEAVALGGYEVPAGSSVMLCPYATHRNPRYFARPDEFDPDRWEGISLPKFAYFPFGGGAKMCIGDAFARMEAVLAMATIGQRWRLLSDDESAVEIRLGVTLRPSRAIWMRPEPRTR